MSTSTYEYSMLYDTDYKHTPRVADSPVNGVCMYAYVLTSVCVRLQYINCEAAICMKHEELLKICNESVLRP